MRFKAITVAALMIGAGVSAVSAAEEMIEGRMHHLRSGEVREWDEFPSEAEGKELLVRFKSMLNSSERTLRVRHRDLKQQWTIQLNGKEIAKLPQDENAMITYWAVPAGVLREGDNALRIGCGGGVSDDIMIGELELLGSSREAALSEASIDVNVLDGDQDAPLPCRITVTDVNGDLVEFGNTSDVHLAVRAGVAYSADGAAHLSLPAGSYRIYAGRGFAYSLDSAALELKAGDAAKKTLHVRRIVSIPMYVACDTHVHTLTYSRHGDATLQERMLTLAGEGIELPIATDHNLQIDYEEAARQMKVRGYFTPVMGNEVTTAALGHFNVFPIAKGAKLLNFRAPTWAALSRNFTEVAGNPVVILNHARDIHGGFRPFDPSRHLSSIGEEVDGPDLPANAMEVINSGAARADPMELYRDWFGMLNRGRKLTPIGSSDSHDVSRYIVGQGRTYVRCDSADPGRIDVERAMRNLREGRVLVSYGLLTDITVGGKFGPGDLASASGDLEVAIRVLGPAWTRATRVTLYANGVKIREEQIGVPTQKPEPAGVQWSGKWTIPRPKHDAWLVAIAMGPGIDQPYWPTAKPYQPTTSAWTSYVLGSSGVVWLDADGSGKFESAYDYAKDVVEKAHGKMKDVVNALADYDEATAAQAAGILWRQAPESFEKRLKAAMENSGASVKRGFAGFLNDLAQAKPRAPATQPGHPS